MPSWPVRGPGDSEIIVMKSNPMQEREEASDMWVEAGVQPLTGFSGAVVESTSEARNCVK